MLEVADRIVAGITDRAAAKGGQLGEMDGPDRLDAAAKFFQRVLAIELAVDQRGVPRADTPEFSLVVTRWRRLRFRRRFGGEEAVAADFSPPTTLSNRQAQWPASILWNALTGLASR